MERTEENLPKFQAYIQDVIRPHRDDPRVLWWEIFNEPKMKSEYTRKLRKAGRMHPSADEDRGLRIDFTDPDPIPAGAVGVRAHRVSAQFDNVIVLPIDALPK